MLEAIIEIGIARTVTGDNVHLIKKDNFVNEIQNILRKKITEQWRFQVLSKRFYQTIMIFKKC